jgi:hypothetical protein
MESAEEDVGPRWKFGDGKRTLNSSEADEDALCKVETLEGAEDAIDEGGRRREGEGHPRGS